jgi:hypothetical protein
LETLKSYIIVKIFEPRLKRIAPHRMQTFRQPVLAGLHCGGCIRNSIGQLLVFLARVYAPTALPYP